MSCKKYKIYIAGKLADSAHKYNSNKKRMYNTAIEVKNAGFSVFVPSLIDRLAEIDNTKDWGYDDYFDNSQPWLEVSDAIFLTPGWKESKGTKKEIETANELGIPVFEDLEIMKSYFKAWERLDNALEQYKAAKNIGEELDKEIVLPECWYKGYYDSTGAHRVEGCNNIIIN